VKTAVAQSSDKVTGEKTINENCTFVFKSAQFVPLIETKIINATVISIDRQEKNVRVGLQTATPIESLAGMSIFIETEKDIDIESIKFGTAELPIIKPSQDNDLPFTKWFNNPHCLTQNHHLFGTYEYWQEIRLTNTANLFYIGNYDPKTVPLTRKSIISLDITLSSEIDVRNNIKINCIPVVNVEKTEATLSSQSPVQKLYTENHAFLNLLYDGNEAQFDKYPDSFLVRQSGAERYNFNRMLEQMQDILHKYVSDYYAFLPTSKQNTDEPNFDDKSEEKMKRMQEAIHNITDSAKKVEHTDTKGGYYAVLKKNDRNNNRSTHLSYLTTLGAAANGIKNNVKASSIPHFLDPGKTALLLDTKGGKNSVTDPAQKVTIAKYYFQTKDRIVTVADIQAFIKTFYFDEGKCLGDEIENITIQRANGSISIATKLKNDSALRSSDKLPSLKKMLQSKIRLKSTGIVPFEVVFL
jgi:hypothetical protein